MAHNTAANRRPTNESSYEMTCETQIRRATPQDVEVVSEILKEAARWLEQAGIPLWRETELEPASIGPDVSTGLFFLAEHSGAPAGTVKFQLEDPLFWPDVPPQEAAYIHRLAVRRAHAGTGLSSTLLRWAAERAQTLGFRYLRLDCVAARPRLRAVYERFGFEHHSDRQVGPYFVSRYQYDTSKTPHAGRWVPHPPF
jgi:GNAT superfamily N-acetyltransferase